MYIPVNSIGIKMNERSVKVMDNQMKSYYDSS